MLLMGAYTDNQLETFNLEIQLYKKEAFMKFSFDFRSAVMNDTVKL